MGPATPVLYRSALPCAYGSMYCTGLCSTPAGAPKPAICGHLKTPIKSLRHDISFSDYLMTALRTRMIEDISFGPQMLARKQDMPGRDLCCLALNLDPAPANGSYEGRMILLGLVRISFAERRYGLVDDVALPHVTGHHCGIT